MIARTAELPESWDQEFDVVVIGSGSAGLSSAIVAACEGLSVIVLEKAELIGGTTAISGGGAYMPGHRHMADVGIEDSRDDALAYMRACAGDQGDDELLVALADHGADALVYLEDRGGMELRAWPGKGGALDYRPWEPGSRPGGRTLDAGKFRLADLGEWADKLRSSPLAAWRMDRLVYYGEGLHATPVEPGEATQFSDVDGPIEYYAAGAALAGQLLKSALAQGVTILTSTPAKDLIVDQSRVIGVEAEHDGSTINVRARRGVVVGTGGFGKNEELKRIWLNRPLEVTCEIDENEGDGHLMGIAVGAQVANLGDAWWMPSLAAGSNPDGTTAFGGSREDRSLPHTMIVNQRGKRFVNESLNYYDVCEAFGLKTGGTRRNLPAWYIFDQQGVDKYQAVARRIPPGDKPDWLIVADTIRDLAEQIGIDPDQLEQTVERFNGFAREGVDPDFNRGESDWDVAWGDKKMPKNASLGTLERGPFYALEVKSGALATKGGLRVNASGQVLSAARPFAPIPGLYASGNCSNAGVPGAYPGPGAGVGAAMTFGYIIGTRLGSGVDGEIGAMAQSSAG